MGVDRREADIYLYICRGVGPRKKITLSIAKIPNIAENIESGLVLINSINVEMSSLKR